MQMYTKKHLLISMLDGNYESINCIKQVWKRLKQLGYNVLENGNQPYIHISNRKGECPHKLQSQLTDACNAITRMNCTFRYIPGRKFEINFRFKIKKEN